MEFNEEDLRKARKRLYFKIFIVILLISFVVATFSSAITYKYAINKFSILDLKVKASDDTTNTEAIAKSLERFREVINKYFKGNIDEEKLLDGAIKGYIDGLGDKYTTYMTAEEWAEFEESALGNFVGVGIYMMLNENELVEVISPIQDSPAEKAGIMAGDIIVKVNDESVVRFKYRYSFFQN